VIRIATAPGALDGAVAQTRALLDRLQKGALADADLEAARAVQAKRQLAASLDPRARLASVWRGDPAPGVGAAGAVNDVCAKLLKDDALVYVAVRPRVPKP
jgi:hypothetical protein